MAWMNACAAACVWDCHTPHVSGIAKRRGVATRRVRSKQPGTGKPLYDVPMNANVSPKMYRSAAGPAVIEKWRQYAVELGLLDETDELERLVIDIDAGEDHARFYVERKGDMRQLAVTPPMVKFL